MATSDDYTRGETDGDRLPWLETVEDDHDEPFPVVRIVLLVLLALAILAAAILGFRYYQTHRGVDGDGGLIAAQDGDYKVRPDDPGGSKVDGEGDTAIATSNGAGTGNASIDLSRTAEQPIAGRKAVTPAPATGSTRGVTPIPAPAGAAAGAASGSSLVQLGSFPDEASANAAWSETSRTLAFLAPLGKSVQAAQVNGRTVYRLRVNAGSAGQARAVCGRIKAAGAACFVPRS